MHRYERWIVRRYLANALRASRFAKPPRSGSDIIAWLETHGRSIGSPISTSSLGGKAMLRSRGLASVASQARRLSR